MKCEYELTNEFLIFRNLGNEFRFNWTNVEEFIVYPDDIEIRMNSRRIAIIPYQLFGDQIQREEWIMFIKEKVQNK